MVVLETDIALERGIKMTGGTEVLRRRDGSLKVSTYGYTGVVKAGAISDYVWSELVFLKRGELKLRFAEWLSRYHSDIKVIAEIGRSESKLSYKMFLKKLSNCVFIFT